MIELSGWATVAMVAVGSRNVSDATVGAAHHLSLRATVTQLPNCQVAQSQWPPGWAEQLSGCRAKGGLAHTQHKHASACTDHQSGSPKSNCRRDSALGLNT